MENDVKAMMPKVGQASEEAVVQFISGGLFGLIMWWLGSRKRLSVEEVDDIFRQLAIPAIKVAVR
jgi:hypothetical protein